MRTVFASSLLFLDHGAMSNCLVQALMDEWRAELARKPLGMTQSDACQILGIETNVDSEVLVLKHSSCQRHGHLVCLLKRCCLESMTCLAVYMSPNSLVQVSKLIQCISLTEGKKKEILAY